MDKYRSSKLAMYKTVKQVMEANESSRMSLPALEEKYIIFREKLALLKTMREEQNEIFDGVNAHKEAMRSLATEKAMKIISALKAYAEVEGIEVVQDAMKITRTKLNSDSRANFLLDLMKVVHVAEDHLSALDPYRIVAADIAELLTLEEELEVLLFVTRTTIIDHKVINDEIIRVMKAEDRLLKKVIDPLMEFFSSEDPDFYFKYKSARRIIKHGFHKGSHAEGTNTNPEEE